ncbi:hypothetical protein QFZ97_007148 [Paraburkholderia youngii]
MKGVSDSAHLAIGNPPLEARGPDNDAYAPISTRCAASDNISKATVPSSTCIEARCSKNDRHVLVPYVSTRNQISDAVTAPATTALHATPVRPAITAGMTSTVSIQETGLINDTLATTSNVRLKDAVVPDVAISGWPARSTDRSANKPWQTGARIPASNSHETTLGLRVRTRAKPCIPKAIKSASLPAQTRAC